LRKWNLWIWESPSWRVIACYATKAEAQAAAKHAADPRDTWKIIEADSKRDEYVRQNCTKRNP
jgi:hypothetical protein